MPQIELSQGTVSYRESGPADGPVIVLLHGLFANGRFWERVAPRLSRTHRVIVPDLPLGAHELPLAGAADRSVTGVADLIGEFMEALALQDATLVGNDTGGALAQLVATRHPQRLGRLVLLPCDAFDNFLPPLFKGLEYAAKVPGGLTAFIRPLSIGPARDLPIAFGWLAKERIPRELTDEWLEHFFADKGVRRDVRDFLRSISPEVTLQAAEDLTRFDKPALVIWASEDKVFPLEHAERLAKLIPDSRLERVDGSRSFIPIDQPERLAELIGDFAAAPTPA